ncbi:MAG: hypothetical protein ABJB69_06440 [Spartobacteria bacterium]
MNQAVLPAIAVTGFGIAFSHAAIPTHWLPFILTGRVQSWSSGKTVGITALAGTGHCIITAAFGLGITWFGLTLDQSIGQWFGRLAGGALFLFGIYYFVRQIIGHGHVHFDYPHEHLHQADSSAPTARRSDRAAITSLLAFLTLSPCEAFLPIYVSGIRYGWKGFAILTLILSVATVAGMVVFTSLTLAGLNRMRLAWLEKYESGMMAVLLCAVGILILIFER